MIGAQSSPLPKHRELPYKISSDTYSQLESSIESYSVILGTTKNPKRRLELIQLRAQAEIALVQNILLDPERTKDTEKLKKILMQAKKDALDTLNNAKGYFIAGLSFMYLDEYTQASQYFNKALEKDPHSKDAPWIAFFLAEEFFEQYQYQKSIDLYLKYINQADSSLKQMGFYKIAWAYASLNEGENAKRYFLKVITLDPKTELSKDALKDLAFMATQLKSEDEIFNFAKSAFKTQDLEHDFLKQVYQQKQNQGIGTHHSKILIALLTLEKNPVEKIKLLVSTLHSLKREYASREAYQLFLQIREIFKTTEIDPKEFGEIEKNLELAIQNLIISDVDTFTEKVKSPENIPITEQGDNLKQVCSFFIDLFSESHLRENVFNLWLEVDKKLKDWNDFVLVTKLILKDKQINTHFKIRTSLEQIASLEELWSKDPKKIQPQLISSLKFFYENNFKHPDWIKVAKRLSSLFMDQKSYPPALLCFTKIYEIEPTGDNFYWMQYTRFRLHQYQAVLDDKNNALFQAKKDSKLEEILRESALQAALKARQEKKLNEYTQLIHRFLALQQDSQKSKIARIDYLSFLIDENKYDEAFLEILSIKEDERFSVDYKKLIQKIVLIELKKGNFEKIIKLQKPNEYSFLLAQLALRQSIDIKNLNLLPNDKKEYLLGLMALLDPKQALLYFQLKSTLLSHSENAIALVALRIEKRNWNFSPTAKELQWIGNLLPESMKTYELTPIEKKILKLPSLSQGGSSSKKHEKNLELLIQQARTLRTKLNAEIKDKPVRLKLRILSTFKKMEQRCAQMIQESPPPKQLNKEDILKYKKELIQVSQEFLDQSRQIESLEQGLQNLVTKEALDSKPLSQPSLQKWPWPPLSKDAKKILDLISKKEWVASLILVDLLRQDFVKKDLDYYLIRTGILLGSNDSQAMRKYLSDELAQMKQEKIIEIWKECMTHD